MHITSLHLAVSSASGCASLIDSLCHFLLSFLCGSASLQPCCSAYFQLGSVSLSLSPPCSRSSAHLIVPQSSLSLILSISPSSLLASRNSALFLLRLFRLELRPLHSVSVSALALLAWLLSQRPLLRDRISSCSPTTTTTPSITSDSLHSGLSLCHPPQHSISHHATTSTVSLPSAFTSSWTSTLDRFDRLYLVRILRAIAQAFHCFRQVSASPPASFAFLPTIIRRRGPLLLSCTSVSDLRISLQSLLHLSDSYKIGDLLTRSHIGLLHIASR